MKSHVVLPGCLGPLCWGPFRREKQKNPVRLPLPGAGAATRGVRRGASMLKTALAPFPERHVSVLKNFMEVVNNEKL